MFKRNLIFALLCSLAVSASAQNFLLNEDFENGQETTEGGEDATFVDPNMPAGWSVVSSYVGNDDTWRWHNYFSARGVVSGRHSATCDAPFSFNTPDDPSAWGPKDEILLTPELDLNGTYELSFLWKAPSASVLDNKEFELVVRVVEEGQDPKAVADIWSNANKEQLKESGVTQFPWTGWQVYKSAIDLSKYQGKKVKIAFVHKMLKKGANIGYFDNIQVKEFTPITAPQPQLSKTMYNFGQVYIGSRSYSEAITLKNIGSNGLTISEVVAPAGVTTTIKPEEVKLDKNETMQFAICYDAKLTTPATGEVIIKTNGGDAKVQINATKLAVPDGGMFEGFEKGVPPAGWTNKGWSVTGYAIEGDLSAYCSGSLSGARDLISPRLDLSTGNHELKFTYFNQYDSEDGTTVASNDICVYLSTDGGETWTKKDMIDYEDGFNAMTNLTVNLGAPASDNCYVKWTYSAVEIDPEYGAEMSMFFLDRVVLPSVYGLGGVPAATTAIAPVHNAVDVYNKDIKLEWNLAQFATGYKVYVGTNAEANNLVDGVDVKDNTSYVIPECQYATIYNWKVVPYNEAGVAENVPTWKFITMADQTVSAYPYFEGFEGEGFPTLGWRMVRNGYTKWFDNEVKAFDGKKSASATAGDPKEETILETPGFNLPTDKDVRISFYWGNDMSVDLEKDPSGTIENPTNGHNGIEATWFEIYVDGAWKQLGILSDSEGKYWYRETFDLSEYKGKTVSFRWRYAAENYFESQGVSLDNISIEASTEDMATFNVTEWNAGTVNYNEIVNSGDIFTLLNDGSKTLTVESVEFTTANFVSTLAAGTVVEPQKGAKFALTFKALESAAEIIDKMLVKFVGGYSVEFPVKGIALAQDVIYYNFESDAPGTTQPTGFTTIDVDKKATINLTSLDYPGYGLAFAYIVQEDDTWNNMFEPVSGKQVLVSLGRDDYGQTDDWLVSRKLKATPESNFRFHVRNWEGIYAIMPWNRAKIEVLVSTTSNTDTKAFETVMEATELPLYDEVAYNVFNVDLSKYAGQSIYVAVRTTVTEGLGTFFDDFYFEHFTKDNTGVDAIEAANELTVRYNQAAETIEVLGAEDAVITIVNMAGVTVETVQGVQANVEALAAGVYIVTVKADGAAHTVRFVKK